MAINLMALTPHKVSRDLSGYITYVYGPPKVGKTTLASQMPNCLLLAFERGYNALPGIIAQDITSWVDIKAVVRELKKPEVKETFKTIAVDTVDIAATLCEKYVCSQNGVQSIGEIPYGQGWNMLKREFDDVFRAISQMGYALIFISHSKEKTTKQKDGTEWSSVGPSVTTTYNSIIENMADIYAYMHPVIEDGVSHIKMDLRSLDGTIACGGRFKHITPRIEASYANLVKALNDAIDKEAAETNGAFVTNERNVDAPAKTFNYDALRQEFQEIAATLMAKDPEYYKPRISFIVEKYLGTGKKVSESGIGQAELIDAIINEIKDQLMK